MVLCGAFSQPLLSKMGKIDWIRIDHHKLDLGIFQKLIDFLGHLLAICEIAAHKGMYVF